MELSSQTLLVLSAFAAGLILGFIISAILLNRKSGTATGNGESIGQLQKQLLESEKERAAALARLDAMQTSEEKQNKLLEATRNDVIREFILAAGKTLDERSKQYSEQNARSLEGLLKPLKDEIHNFHGELRESRIHNAKERGFLKKELEVLTDLNSSLTTEARQLSEALRGSNKTAGTWGETILERVLEESGLARDREFYLQKAYRTEDGRLFRPDAVVRLPGKRSIIVDAKVSLVSYERAFHALTADETSAHMQKHCQSLRRHIDELAAKEYGAVAGDEALETVLMFIPVEPALSVAMNEDPGLFTYALKRNILPVTSATLYLTLRIIDQMWKGDRQHTNAAVIARKAGALYDKIEGFLSDMSNVGQKISEAHKSWTSATRKLSTGPGNILKRSAELKELGAETQKNIEDISFSHEISD